MFGITAKGLLSGFRSRCHVIIKGAFPLHRVHQGLEQLIQLYCLAGFEREELNSISSQILNTQTDFLLPYQFCTFLFLPFDSHEC